MAYMQLNGLVQYWLKPHQLGMITNSQLPASRPSTALALVMGLGLGFAAPVIYTRAGTRVWDLYLSPLQVSVHGSLSDTAYRTSKSGLVSLCLATPLLTFGQLGADQWQLRAVRPPLSQTTLFEVDLDRSTMHAGSHLSSSALV